VTPADIAGPFVGARQLTEKMVQSKELGACVAKQWFRFAMGRDETEADRCALEGIKTRFDKTGGDLGDLLVAITNSESFLNIKTEVRQ
jgi:hypothetical protein